VATPQVCRPPAVKLTNVTDTGDAVAVGVTVGVAVTVGVGVTVGVAVRVGVIVRVVVAVRAGVGTPAASDGVSPPATHAAIAITTARITPINRRTVRTVRTARAVMCRSPCIVCEDMPN
jgi:hypothetical protein